MSTAVELEIEPVSYVMRTPQGGWRVAGTRVGLESIIHAYNEGESPEAMVLSWPTLSLEQIHGAIAFYLRDCWWSASDGARSEKLPSRSR
ncbi:MAG TPA: DUF433 domain-containing protein [Planctomycetaceae bacterium]|nr:DUF433 domain-containing protein [Planctomycetaceae bacterium]